jgi:hypothetical protein
MPNHPTVNRQAVDGFLKVYNQGGLWLLFDEKSKDAMMNFANVVLRSYVTDLQEQAMKLMAAKKAMIEKQAQAGQGQAAPTDAVAAIPVPPAAPQKSLITLTDM